MTTTKDIRCKVCKHLPLEHGDDGRCQNVACECREFIPRQSTDEADTDPGRKP
jgi:hypothetical protein